MADKSMFGEKQTEKATVGRIQKRSDGHRDFRGGTKRGVEWLYQASLLR